MSLVKKIDAGHGILWVFSALPSNLLAEGVQVGDYVQITSNAGITYVMDSDHALQPATTANVDMVTALDTKPVRINSRDYTNSANNNIGMQCKPNQSVDGTSSITGAEFSPRFADACGGGQIRAIAASPFLRGTTGDLTSNVVAVECEFDLGASSTRTVGGAVHAIRCIMNAGAGLTVTGGLTVIKVDNPQGAKLWDALFDIGSDQTTIFQGTAGSAASKYIRLRVGSTFYKIALLADS